MTEKRLGRAAGLPPTNAADADSEFAIVYFSGTDWDATWQRPQQLASRLTRHGQVLYVNSFGLRVPSLKDLGRIGRRIGASINRRVRPLPHSALTIISPLLFLPFPSNRLANRINGWLLRRPLDRWIKRQGSRNLVLWIGIPSPGAMESIKGLAPGLLVYDCIDNVAAFHRNRPDIIETEQRVASTAGVVIATSAELFEKMKRINPNTFLVPNAVNFEQFRAAAEHPLAPPRDMTQLKRPILGYVGEIAEWFDCDLIHDLALQNPGGSIVLIGGIHADISKILQLPNVHYLGLKGYGDIPGYMSQFDVCLLPFKVNSLTNAVNPIKFYEYLAMGKPVVSTPIREIRPYRELVEVADPSGFAAAVKRALLEAGDERRIDQRIQIAQNNTWDTRTAEIIRILRLSIGT